MVIWLPKSEKLSLNGVGVEVLVVFEDRRPSYIRYDQKFIHYKFGNMQRKFEYNENINLLLKKHRTSPECVNSKKRIASILHSCLKNVDILFANSQGMCLAIFYFY